MDKTAAILISKALDGLAMRSLFISQNIANANTPNYKPVSVSFENALKTASSKSSATIGAVTPKVHYSANSGVSSEMRLDLELAQASQTAMRYSALIDILGRQMALSHMVVSGGK